LKLLTEAGVYRTDIERPIEGKNICIFNRSEIVGRPLAMMLSNDGATVVSIDINGPLQFVDAKPAEIDISRAEALSQADIVITGVPSADFVKISNAEIKPDTICLNFSSRANFEANVATSERLFIPRVGPVTVAMCMRNSLRLYKNFHQS
jgi:methylenetetrahydrofolate dehydrogenase (NADP+)/methenyltetrahydrofolate cyclohydrolase